MDRIDIQRKRNQNAGLIRFSNRHRNVLKWGKNESYKHVLTKLHICMALKQLDKEFYTEAILMDGNRADVLCTDLGVIFEVYESEKKESLDRKDNIYPLEIRRVKASSKFELKDIL